MEGQTFDGPVELTMRVLQDIPEGGTIDLDVWDLDIKAT